jgi:hypothetical protein
MYAFFTPNQGEHIEAKVNRENQALSVRQIQ